MREEEIYKIAIDSLESNIQYYDCKIKLLGVDLGGIETLVEMNMDKMILSYQRHPLRIIRKWFKKDYNLSDERMQKLKDECKPKLIESKRKTIQQHISYLELEKEKDKIRIEELRKELSE